jgi:hypothetical protein
MHATYRDDGKEIMGYLQGYAVSHEIIVLDSVPLPCEASETSVFAGNENVFQHDLDFFDLTERKVRKLNVIFEYLIYF